MEKKFKAVAKNSEEMMEIQVDAFRSHIGSSKPKIFFMGTHGGRAIVFWRCVTPAKYIARAQAGHTAIMYGTYTKEAIDWADFVVMQRVAGLGPIKVARYCQMVGKPVIYDIDDNVFNYPDSPEYDVVDTDQLKQNIIDVIQECDALVVTEEVLAERAQEHIKDMPIYIIPNMVDLEFWDAPQSKNYGHKEFLIGWMGGHYHVLDLNLIIEPISHILDKYEHVKFASLGACPPALAEKYPDRVIGHEFVPIEDFPDLMYKMRFDIGIAPLAENDFANCRSNARLLLHSLMSVPTVASNFGPYQRAKDDKFPMITVPNTTEGWVKGLELLINDEKTRKYLGEAAREKTVFKYRAEKVVPLWTTVFREMKMQKEATK